jgi:hypothetical protein
MLDKYLEPEIKHKDGDIKICALRMHHAGSVLGASARDGVEWQAPLRARPHTEGRKTLENHFHSFSALSVVMH